MTCPGPSSFGMLDRLKNNWNLIAQTGVWLMGIIAGFVVAPQLGGPQDEKSVWNLTQFIVNILVGLMLVLTIKFKKKHNLKHWVATTVVALLLGLVGYFSYMNQRGGCTCRYYSKTVLVGRRLREPSKEENTPCEELLKTHAGDVAEIWTSDSITRCRMILAISYVSTVPVFAIALISVLQAVYIVTPKRRG
jgi:MFS family permease